jgi:hypothetical protein
VLNTGVSIHYIYFNLPSHFHMPRTERNRRYSVFLALCMVVASVRMPEVNDCNSRVAQKDVVGTDVLMKNTNVINGL